MSGTVASSAVASVPVPPPSRWITELTAEMPLTEALPQILRQRWEGILYTLPLAIERGQQEPESVHQLRVACRRMAAVLKAFEKTISRKVRCCALKLLGQVRRGCGKSRDLDVQLAFLANLLPHVPPEATPGVGVIREQLLRRRNKAQAKLRTRLESMGEKLERCEQRLNHRGRSIRATPQSHEPFGNACAALLNSEIQKICQETGDETPASHTLHQLRVACKELRYTSEVSAHLLHESFREELYPKLQRVQDLLGAWNDAAVTEASLSRLQKKWKRRRDEERQCDLKGSGLIAWRDLEVGFEAAHQACHWQAESALLEFRRVWPDFVGKSFCQPVRELLTSFQERVATHAIQGGQTPSRRRPRKKAAAH